MGYDLRFEKTAKREFLKLPPTVARRLQPAIERLAGNPRPDAVKKLRGFRNLYRIRVGDYRVIYRIEDESERVLILKISHRRDAY